MTIGDKIKYCRTRNRLSQAKLSELSGISLVSIKRYETNKAVPLPPQIKKLANALGIGALAFSETYFDSLQELETYGDLAKLIMVLRKNHIISIYDDDKTVSFSINASIGKHIQAKMLNSSGEAFNCDVMCIPFLINDRAISEVILKWSLYYTKFEAISEKHKNGEYDGGVLKAIQDELDRIELEMEYNASLLEDL